MLGVFQLSYLEYSKGRGLTREQMWWEEIAGRSGLVLTLTPPCLVTALRSHLSMEQVG